MVIYSYVDRDHKVFVTEYAVKGRHRVNTVVSRFIVPAKISTPKVKVK